METDVLAGREVGSRAGRRAAAVAGIALLVVTVGGCGWKKQVEQLKSDNQKLSQEKAQLTQQVTAAGVETTEMQGTLDDVQKNLEELRGKELQVIKSSIEVVQEGKAPTARREQLKAEIETIRKAIRENLDKLERLEKENAANRAKAASAGKQVKELSGQVTTLERLVGELKSQLEEKSATIDELEKTVFELKGQVEQQANEIQEKTGTIDEQTKEINKVYVAIASKAVLKEKGLVEKKGSILGLGGSWLRTGKFDPEIFKELDRREATEFPIAMPIKKVRVLSDHPKDSYEIVPSGEKACTLKVTDTARFWQGSKYLVVMTMD